MENVEYFSIYFRVLCAPPSSPPIHTHTHTHPTPTHIHLSLSVVSGSQCPGDRDSVGQKQEDLTLPVPFIHCVILGKHLISEPQFSSS